MCLSLKSRDVSLTIQVSRAELKKKFPVSDSASAGRCQKYATRHSPGGDTSTMIQINVHFLDQMRSTRYTSGTDKGIEGYRP